MSTNFVGPRRRGTDVQALIDLVAGRLAESQGNPQGGGTSKAALTHTGYGTVTEQKQAIQGLGSYYHAKDNAVQQLIAEAAANARDHALAASHQIGQDMNAAGATVNQGEDAAARSQWNNMASEYAGRSAALYNDQHPANQAVDTPQPVVSDQRTGEIHSYPMTSPGTPAKFAPQAVTTPKLDPNVVANQQQAVADAPLVAAGQAAAPKLAALQEQLGTVGPQGWNATEQSKAADQAVNDLLYGSDTPYYQQAATDMGVDPLVAWGMFPNDTPAEQLAQYQREQDMESIDSTGLPKAQADAEQARLAKQQTADEATALDNFIQQGVGLSSSAAQSRTGLTAEQIAAIVSQPKWADTVAGQDELMSAAQAGDTDALSQLNALLTASDLSTEERRLLRARMQGLGITDAELTAASG